MQTSDRARLWLTNNPKLQTDHVEVPVAIHRPIEIRIHFKEVINSNKEEGDTMDYVFKTVRCEIRQLTGKKIGRETVKSFYYDGGDPKFSAVKKINSVAAQLKKENLFMTSVHCIAHRLHLAGQDVAKEVLFSVIDALNDDAINAENPKDRIRATQLINNLDTEFIISTMFLVHFIEDEQNISTRLYRSFRIETFFRNNNFSYQSIIYWN
ncbi:hypothetical protein RhiirA1_448381 [Rhizophagus irregularis]|uniref:Uncharacterized protein n=1 Tax=Rhizophagus irregularis TaxID=588596 RepID=A0A2N0SJM8_9GLOM|nr:hypothetical protein RhiirA1_448381 [Rhizophagus irregularis]